MSHSFIDDLVNWGERPALVFPGERTVTYRELRERVALQAAAFRGSRGLVSIEAELSEHAIVAYLAALAAGHAVAMQAPKSGSNGSWVDAFDPDYGFRQVDCRWRTEHLRQGRGALHPELALMLSTSGSTGSGKAVRLSRENISANAASIAAYLGLTADDRGCLILPLHYSYGLSVLNAHLSVGASLYIPGGSILDANFLDGLAASRSTNLSGVPYSYELLERVGFRERRFPSLRFMTVAGGRLGADVVRLYNEHLRERGARFFAMYGQTEATARIAYVPPAALAGNEDRIGVAIPGGRLALENETGGPVDGDGIAGELVYRGPNVMMGYATSRDDLGRGAELEALRTGDLAIRHADGLFQIVGRMKRISKIAGLRIAHDGLEAALEKRGIAAAIVGDDQGLHAFYCGGHGRDAIRRFVAETSGLTPAHVKATVLAEMPRLASGKIDYNALNMAARQAAVGSDDSGGFEELFAQVFYPKKVKRSDSFVSLGGDSLRYVQLSLGLEKALGEPPETWETLSIAELSAQERREAANRRIGTDLVIRALAILLVVLHHETLWPIPGGSAAMVVLAGFSLARFQMGPLLSGDSLAILRPLAQILVPYYLIVAAYALAWGDVPWASVLLVGNVGIATPEARQMVPYLYWFIEAYCQMMLVFVGLFAIPQFRRFVSARPFAAGMALLVSALAARLALPFLWPIGNRQIFTLPWIFYLAVIGWCAAVAESARQRLILLAAGTGAFLFFGLYEGVWVGTKIKYLLQIAVLAALLYLPRIAVPRRVAELILPVSAAGFHIYILHRFVPELLLAPFQAIMPMAVFTLLSIVGGVGLGILAWLGQRSLLKKMTAWRQEEIRPVRSLLSGALRFPLRPL
ncbi:AMP-binding protein [Ensifer sp.]|jgi:acyl-CoA synthetase (AMP-forming)/AMP-acid ligase II|uniref:AMP-binding protein n=1 Tax=Ensifer sp. TaxID=1872086 RepID=UPI002E150938|nr:AMP-binding protein [Ensifer sp.]